MDELGGDGVEGEWVDEVGEDGLMLDVERSADGEEKVGNVKDGTVGGHRDGLLGEVVEDGIL